MQKKSKVTNKSRAERDTKFFAILKDKDIRKRILFTLLIFAVFKAGSIIPVSGVDASSIKTVIENNSFLGLLNMMGGGSLSQMSVFALGVSPYITSSIIIQLLAMDVIPALTDMSKDGEKGKKKMEKVTRYFSVVLAFIQAISIVMTLDKSYEIVEDASAIQYLFIALSMTAGSMLLVWLGDKITTYGIGNGLSMIIFAGIVTGIPTTFESVFASWVLGAEEGYLNWGIFKFVLYCLLYLFVILVAIWLDDSIRKIPVHYSSSGYNGNMSYIPFKINSASVVPVIFAQSIISAPQIIVSYFSTDAYNTLTDIFSFQKPFGLGLYAILIFLFTFFYTEVTVQPDELAKNLNQSGAFIPGIHPGYDTEVYTRRTLYRVSFFGALGLMFIALIPYLLTIFTSLSQSTAIGGTGIIIVVGVAIETEKEIKSRIIHKKQSQISWR